MKVVIMAAGKGKRLEPLTNDKPKCMVEVAGKPIIDHILDAVATCAIDEVAIIDGYKKKILEDHILKKYYFLDTHFIEQKKLNGTANAIYLAKDYVDKSFVVLSSDVLITPDQLTQLLKNPNSLFYTSQYERLYEYGTLDMEEEYIRFINEKSTRPTSHHVNCGLYNFKEEIFDYIERTHVDNRFGEKIITNAINLMTDDGILFKGIYMKNLLEISRISDIKEIENYYESSRRK